MKLHYVVIYTYIYQTGPFKFRLLVRTQHYIPVFQKSMSEGFLPQSWKVASVAPIFKKGRKSAPGNYRPISLTNMVCKLESLVRDYIVTHMTANGLFTSFQHGFIKEKSCATNLLTVLNALTNAIDTAYAVDAMYLDFAKEVDTVPHKRLLIKLWGYAIDGKVLGWIWNFLQGRRQRVAVNGAKFQLFYCV